MKKSDSLRAAITAAVPGLPENPDRLLMFVEGGHIAASPGQTASFEYRYFARLVMLEFGGSTDAVMGAIVLWAQANQPDLFQNRDNEAHGIEFEADVLNNNAVDLSVRVKLTESVVARVGDDGRRSFTHVDDSVPASTDWDSAAWVAGRDLASGAWPKK
ncbi:phage tail protein [Burkholderia contaminans]|uniref:Phage tail protein n=1 Tax=Burkholderia contaminans TaxID=488447 RepID=A0A3N8PDK3_9BURK|nr:phage tail protein [Burkholderia contaminans]RQT09822.1 phage tail protein [Burkholderia contaminans]